MIRIIQLGLNGGCSGEVVWREERGLEWLDNWWLTTSDRTIGNSTQRDLRWEILRVN